MRGYRNTNFIGALAALVLLIGLSACKKDSIDIPEPNDPVFSTEGTIDGTPFRLVAGDDNAYMHTMTEMKNGVQVFSGRIDDQITSVELGIYDGLIDNDNFEVLQSLVGNIFNYAHNDSSTVYMTLSKDLLNNASNGSIQSIEWFVDGVYAGLNEVNIMEPGIYNVCANTTFTDGQTVTLCNELIAGYSRNANCNIEIDMSQPGFIQANLNNPGYSISYVNWYLDGNLITSNAGDFMSAMTPEIHELRAEVHFTNGVTRSKALVFDGENQIHFIDDFTVFEYQAIPFAQDFNVRIEMLHNGVMHYSEPADNSNSTLEITGFEYYGKNPAGNEVYKLSANVNCRVMKEGTSLELPLSFSTVFGVEIQQ